MANRTTGAAREAVPTGRTEEEFDPVGAISYDGFTEPDLPDDDESDRYAAADPITSGPQD